MRPGQPPHLSPRKERSAKAATVEPGPGLNILLGDALSRSALAAGDATPIGRARVDVLLRWRATDGRRPFWLPEREHVPLGTGVEERDLQRPLPDRVVLAHELVQAAVSEQAVPVLVDVHAV
jgi:hypothetical protein